MEYIKPSKQVSVLVTKGIKCFFRKDKDMVKLGIVDFDTSHSVAFTQILNHIDVSEDQWVNGAQVVMGCTGTSLLAPEVISGYTEKLVSYGIEMVDSPADMIGRIGGVMIESQDGSVHYDRAKPFVEAGKPPIDINETLEIVAFIEAVMASSSQDGARTYLKL